MTSSVFVFRGAVGLLLVALLSGGLSGCGQKGPLILPAASSETAATVTPPAPVAPESSSNLFKVNRQI